MSHLANNQGPNLLEKLVQEAKMYKEQGFKAIKMKVGLGLDQDEQHVKAVRKAIGLEVDLMIDANHAYSYSEALELCSRLESEKIKFFEEPISPEFYDQYAQLRSKTNIAIAGGECEYLRHGFKTLMDKKSVDIIQVYKIF